MVIRPNASQWNLSHFMLFTLAVFYLALPSYFAFELTDAMPSFSASRIIIIVTTLIALLAQKKIRIPRNSPIMIIALVWAVLMILLNLLHISDAFSYATKEIFSIFLERVLLVLIVCTYVDSEEKIDEFLHYMVVTSMVLAVIGMVEFVTNYNVFELLETSTRDYLQSHYDRAGMHRTASSFGHAVYYALYCTCMLPFSLYLFEKTRRRLYMICMSFNVVGILMSGTRGQLFPLFLVALSYVAFADKRIRFRYVRALLAVMAVISVICIAVPDIRNFILQNVLSLLNELGFDVSVSEHYGTNSHGIESRIMQFSGVRWLILNNKFWFGFGPVPAYRGLVSYYYPNYGWVKTESIDVGYISWFLSFGLAGFLTNAMLFVTLLYYSYKYSKRFKHRTNTLEFAFLVFVIIYLVSLFNSSGNGDLLWIVIALMIVHQRCISSRDTPANRRMPDLKVPEIRVPEVRKPRKVRVKVRRK